MKKQEKQLLNQLEDGAITPEMFSKAFPFDLNAHPDYLIANINKAIKADKPSELNALIFVTHFIENKAPFTDILNELLIQPNHRYHQFITKTLQNLKNPSSIAFIEKVLSSKFSYLYYTCSESATIAKWFSWALSEIGTKEAIDVLKKYAQSEDKGVAQEMSYRLSKMIK
jgi:HEAT repeat protein